VFDYVIGALYGLMRAKNLLLPLILFFTVNAVLHAQNSVTPNLSGTWKLNPEKSKFSKHSKVQPQTLVITCSGASVQMHYTTDGKESTHAYIVDGKERTVGQFQDAPIFVKARWKGPVLIIERRAVPQSGWGWGFAIMHITEHWELSGDGRLLMVDEDDPKRPMVYDKLVDH
jgi:hypothetical protein